MNCPASTETPWSPAPGSVGITAGSVVHDAETAIAYLNHLRKTLPGRDALIQEYLTGTEYSVGLIGNPGLGFNVLPPLENVKSPIPVHVVPLAGGYGPATSASE